MHSCLWDYSCTLTPCGSSSVHSRTSLSTPVPCVGGTVSSLGASRPHPRGPSHLGPGSRLRGDEEGKDPGTLSGRKPFVSTGYPLGFRL